MSLEDEKKFKLLMTSDAVVEDFEMPDLAAAAEVGSRDILLEDLAMLSLATTKLNGERVLTLLSALGPMVSSGGEDAKHFIQGVARALPRAAKGENSGTTPMPSLNSNASL